MADVTYILNPSAPEGLTSSGLYSVQSLSSIPPGSPYLLPSTGSTVWYAPAAPSTSSPSTPPPAPTGPPPPGASPSIAGGGGTGDIEVRQSAADIAAARPVQAPARMMLPDEVVEVTALPANGGNFRVSTGGPNGAKFGPGLILTPTGVPRQVNVRVLSDLWIYGLAGTNAGDGVSITIRNQARQ